MFNLGPTEIVVIVVVAILIFGPRLPQVAAEFAGWIMKLKRSLNDLRRDSGIDREISEVRRQVENAVPREVRSFNVERKLNEAVESVKQDIAKPVADELEAARDAVTKDVRREPLGHPEESPAVTPLRADPEAPPAATDPRP